MSVFVASIRQGITTLQGNTVVTMKETDSFFDCFEKLKTISVCNSVCNISSDSIESVLTLSCIKPTDREGINISQFDMKMSTCLDLGYKFIQFNI